MVDYNKLVRDNIPEIILNENKVPYTHIADEKEYFDLLKKKLKEEVEEFIEEASEEELADIEEVLEALYKIYDKEKVLEIKKKKAEKRGKFEKRIVLEKVE
jgi:predicted house-cleaning noncanonical NTP pyrophosphatase (MazG superfamily)